MVILIIVLDFVSELQILKYLIKEDKFQNDNYSLNTNNKTVNVRKQVSEG